MNKIPTDKVEEFVDRFNVHKYDIPAKKATLADLFRTHAIRRNAILMSISWMAFSMGYFGLVYNTPAFSWSPFLVFVFPGLVILPLCIFDPIMVNKFGRKFMLTVPLITAGVLLLITIAVPKGSIAIIILSWAGTVFCGFAFSCGYTFSKELFPTTLRTSALSMASAAARIGSILSPFVAMTQGITFIKKGQLRITITIREKLIHIL